MSRLLITFLPVSDSNGPLIEHRARLAEAEIIVSQALPHQAATLTLHSYASVITVPCDDGPCPKHLYAEAMTSEALDACVAACPFAYDEPVIEASHSLWGEPLAMLSMSLREMIRQERDTEGELCTWGPGAVLFADADWQIGDECFHAHPESDPGDHEAIIVATRTATLHMH